MLKLKVQCYYNTTTVPNIERTCSTQAWQLWKFCILWPQKFFGTSCMYAKVAQAPACLGHCCGRIEDAKLHLTPVSCLALASLDCLAMPTSHKGITQMQKLAKTLEPEEQRIFTDGTWTESCNPQFCSWPLQSSTQYSAWLYRRVAGNVFFLTHLQCSKK